MTNNPRQSFTLNPKPMFAWNEIEGTKSYYFTFRNETTNRDVWVPPLSINPSDFLNPGEPQDPDPNKYKPVYYPGNGSENGYYTYPYPFLQDEYAIREDGVYRLSAQARDDKGSNLASGEADIVLLAQAVRDAVDDFESHIELPEGDLENIELDETQEKWLEAKVSMLVYRAGEFRRPDTGILWRFWMAVVLEQS